VTILGTDAAAFQTNGASGDALENSGAITVRSYSITLRATQVGATGSPFDQAFTINGTDSVAMTTLTVRSTSGSNIPANTFVEFGLPIAAGVLTTSSSRVQMVDAVAATMVVQQDQIATDQSGGQRWCRVTSLLATAPGAQSTTLDINVEGGSPATANPVTPSNILTQSISGDTYECKVTATMPNGDVYTALASTGLSASSTYAYGSAVNFGAVRSGGLVTEFKVQVPFVKSGPTTHPFLVAEFWISAYKRSVAAWNSSTNPIVHVATQVCLYNGYVTIASPSDLVYDLLITVGAGSPSTVYQLNGGAGSAAITLSPSTSGTGQTATLGSGTWARSATPNSSDIGKAIVETSGNGRGWLYGYQTTTATYLMIPTATAFASTSLASGDWKKMGVYHCSQTRNVPAKVYWPTSAAPAYDPILPVSYMLASEMVMNYAADSTTTGAPDLSALTNDGGHPMGMYVTTGFIKNYSTNEAATGDADHIGVMSTSQTVALLNWDDATEYDNARKLALAQGQAGCIKPYWNLHDEYGGVIGIDDTGMYLDHIGQPTNGTTRAFLVKTAFAQFGQPWFAFAHNHSGATDYFCYLVTGEPYYLQGLAAMCVSYCTGVSDAVASGVVDPFAINDPSGATTDFVATGGTYPTQTGEAIYVLWSGSFPQYLGNNLDRVNRFFLRRVNSSTFNLYDTYAHSIAGGATGKITLTGGTGISIQNGYGWYGVKGSAYGGVLTGQARQVAWGYRTVAQLLVVSPDSGADTIISRSFTRSNVQRWHDNIVDYYYVNNATNSNYISGGPRYVQLNGSNCPTELVISQWQNNYARLALVQGSDAGAFQAGSHAADWFDWLLADSNQWAVRSDESPFFMVGAYYTRCINNAGTLQFTYNGIYQESMRVPFGQPAAFGKWGATGIYTATIASVANQAAITVVLTPVAAAGNYFDNANPTRNVGSWIIIGSGIGQITSVTNATTCVVDTTVATWDGCASGNIGMSAGAGQTCTVSYPSWGNAGSIVGTTQDYVGAGGQDQHYLWLESSAIQIAKQRGIDSSNYTAAVAHLTARALPSNPPSHAVFTTPCATAVKGNVTSRV
jgi:hypothetical protein